MAVSADMPSLPDPALSRQMAAITAKGPVITLYPVAGQEETAMEQCSAIPPVELLQAVEEFNRGDWFVCHETLEELWVGAAGQLRYFYQGLLQLAVAQHHWRNGNYQGAVILLKGGADLLGRVESVCQGVDVAGLRAAALALHAELAALGEEEMAALPENHLLTVRWS